MQHWPGVPAITTSAWRTILADADARVPEEACGILLGSPDRIDDARPAPNVHPEPRCRFTIDPQALIDAHRAAREGGPSIVGYYHSHPASPPEPSATDAAMAAGDGMVWAIMGRVDGEWRLRFWRDAEASFVPLSYSATGR